MRLWPKGSKGSQLSFHQVVTFHCSDSRGGLGWRGDGDHDSTHTDFPLQIEGTIKGTSWRRAPLSNPGR